MPGHWQGEARTKAASEKLKRDMAHTIASFSTLDFSHKDESSLYAFDGDAKDAPILSDAGASAPFVIEMGTRNRKQIVDLDAEKKAAAARPPAKTAAKGAVKVGRGEPPPPPLPAAACASLPHALLPCCARRCPCCSTSSSWTASASRSSSRQRTRPWDGSAILPTPSGCVVVWLVCHPARH